MWLQKAFLLASTIGRPNGMLPAPERYSANGPSARLLEIILLCGMVAVQTQINQVIELHLLANIVICSLLQQLVTSYLKAMLFEFLLF